RDPPTGPRRRGRGRRDRPLRAHGRTLGATPLARDLRHASPHPPEGRPGTAREGTARARLSAVWIPAGDHAGPLPEGGRQPVPPVRGFALRRALSSSGEGYGEA